MTTPIWLEVPVTLELTAVGEHIEAATSTPGLFVRFNVMEGDVRKRVSREDAQRLARLLFAPFTTRILIDINADAKSE
jgi:hypothetical protein